MIENKKVISRSLIVLFLALAIVYSLAYMKKSDLFKWEIEKSSIQSDQVSLKNTENQINVSTGLSVDMDESVASTWANLSSSVNLWDVARSSWVNSSNTQAPWYESSTSLRLASTNAKTLPGTTEYFWVLDIVSILWVKPEITLQDSRWNYFAYYWESLDFGETIVSLGGNIYEMVTESEILQNQLFGDRVSYINLSTFKDIRVIMVVEIDGDVWLLQIPADKYHQSKDYLKSLFIQ